MLERQFARAQLLPSNLMRVPPTINPTFQALHTCSLAAHVMGANATRASDRFVTQSQTGPECSLELDSITILPIQNNSDVAFEAIPA